MQNKKLNLTMNDLYRGKDAPAVIDSLEGTVGIEKINTMNYLKLYWSLCSQEIPIIFQKIKQNQKPKKKV